LDTFPAYDSYAIQDKDGWNLILIWITMLWIWIAKRVWGSTFVLDKKQMDAIVDEVAK